MAAFEIKKFVPASPELGQITGKQDKVDSPELARYTQNRPVCIKTGKIDSPLRCCEASSNA